MFNATLQPLQLWDRGQYSLYRKLGVPQGLSEREQIISYPPGFDPRTVQPVAIRYTDWNIPAHSRKNTAI